MMESYNQEQTTSNQQEEKSKDGFVRNFLNPTASTSNEDHNRVSKAIPYVLFLVLLAMIHISNNHIAENKIRTIDKYEKDLKEYRWEFMTTQSEMMLKSRQSALIEYVEPLGLKELRTPLNKISVKSNDNK